MMKTVLFLSTVALLASAASAQQNTTVQSYTKSDGTYVQSYNRTAPDSTRTNNYSSSPNVNPYTGEHGTVNPYAPKPPSNPYAPKKSPY